ncbi:MAG: hypothetical protein HRT99_00545 [Mycoplasmatales bacterium]|nr:hypothetical protein [Mycoplasmatales bacterium]
MNKKNKNELTETTIITRKHLDKVKKMSILSRTLQKLLLKDLSLKQKLIKITTDEDDLFENKEKIDGKIFSDKLTRIKKDKNQLILERHKIFEKAENLNKQILDLKEFLAKEREILKEQKELKKKIIKEEILDEEKENDKSAKNIHENDINDEKNEIEDDIKINDDFEIEYDEIINDSNDSISVYDMEYEDNKKNNNLFIRAEFDGEAKNRKINSYIIKEQIENFYEIPKDAIDIREIIAYVFVILDKNISSDEIHDLYKKQLIWLLNKKTVEFGNYYITSSKIKMSRIIIESIEKSFVLSIFKGEGLKIYREIINQKLNEGAIIKISNGIAIYLKENKLVIAQNENVTGA